MEVLDSENKEFNSGLKWLAVLRIVFVATYTFNVLYRLYQTIFFSYSLIELSDMATNLGRLIGVLIQVGFIIILSLYHLKQAFFELDISSKKQRPKILRWTNLILLSIFSLGGIYSIYNLITTQFFSELFYKDVFIENMPLYLVFLLSMTLLIMDIKILFSTRRNNP